MFFVLKRDVTLVNNHLKKEAKEHTEANKAVIITTSKKKEHQQADAVFSISFVLLGSIKDCDDISQSLSLNALPTRVLVQSVLMHVLQARSLSDHKGAAKDQFMKELTTNQLRSIHTNNLL